MIPLTVKRHRKTLRPRSCFPRATTTKPSVRSIPTNVHESSLIRDLRGLRRSLKWYSQGATVRSGPSSTWRSISTLAQSPHEPRPCLGRDDRPRRIASSSGAPLSCLPRRASCPRGSRSRCQWIAPRGASLRGLQNRILLREKAQRLNGAPACLPLGVVFRPALGRQQSRWYTNAPPSLVGSDSTIGRLQMGQSTRPCPSRGFSGMSLRRPAHEPERRPARFTPLLRFDHRLGG